nr:uncharacterized protein LOC122579993 isoform X2 [Erigeron canadensis]
MIADQQEQRLREMFESLDNLPAYVWGFAKGLVASEQLNTQVKDLENDNPLKQLADLLSQAMNNMRRDLKSEVEEELRGLRGFDLTDLCDKANRLEDIADSLGNISNELARYRFNEQPGPLELDLFTQLMLTVLEVTKARKNLKKVSKQMTKACDNIKEG